MLYLSVCVIGCLWDVKTVSSDRLKVFFSVYSLYWCQSKVQVSKSFGVETCMVRRVLKNNFMVKLYK